MKKSKKVSIVIPSDVYSKIEYYVLKDRMKSFSAMTCKLLEEALENYDDPEQPKLPL